MLTHMKNVWKLRNLQPNINKNKFFEGHKMDLKNISNKILMAILVSITLILLVSGIIFDLFF